METASDPAPAAVRNVDGAYDGIERTLSAAQVSAAIYARRPELGRLDEKQLRKAAHARRVPAAFVNAHPRFNDAELEAWLVDYCRCPYVDIHGTPCERVGLGESRGCAAHGHTLIGAGAAGKPRPEEVGRKISKTKLAKPYRFSIEQRGRMRAAKGCGPAELRYCKCGCGEPLLRDDAEFEDVPLDILERYGLVDSQRDFFSRSCHIVWAWTHDRRRFPQGDRTPIAFPCDIGCGRTVHKSPSQIAIRETGRYRFLCDTCDSIYRRYRQSAEQRALDATPRAGLPSNATLAAVDRIWETASRFEAEIVREWPKTGRRPPFASDLVILALHRRGFTDEQVASLLTRSMADGHKISGVQGSYVDAKYVERRRGRQRIYRTTANKAA
jgi:hypothetical protein